MSNVSLTVVVVEKLPVPYNTLGFVDPSTVIVWGVPAVPFPSAPNTLKEAITSGFGVEVPSVNIKGWVILAFNLDLTIDWDI